MSGYVKNTWVNQDVERPKTYEVTTNADGSITLTDSFGLVTELGTPVNADNMNHIEDGLTRVSITEYDNTFTYSEDDWVTGVVEGEKTICRSKTDNNTGNALSNDTYWEVLKLGGGGSGYQLFDIVMKDHVLSYEESLGLAPLGTYVYKEAIAGTRYGYPSFYQKCVDEYNDINNTTETVDSVTVTINANRHKFYDIADKATFDNMYAITGEAWYYGIDTTNERVFLPRSTRFKNGTTSDVGGYQPAGLPNITGKVLVPQASDQADGESLYADGAGLSWGTSGNAGQRIIHIDASRSSSIYGASDTVEYSSTKLIPYMVVGNVANESAVTDVIDITTSENDTIPLGYSTYSGEVLNPRLGWLKSEGQWNSGSVYTTFYNEAVTNLNNDFGAGKIVEHTDTYTDYDLVINQTNETFRLPLLDGSETLPGDVNNRVILSLGASGDTYTQPKNGYYELSVTSNISYWYLENTTTGICSGATNAGNGYTSRLFVEANKDDIVKVSYQLSPTSYDFYFVPAVGNGSLYFKVANAVQNLELLDVGEVLEAVNTVSAKIDNTPHITDTYENGTSGYIVYSNGYCEQWGFATSTTVALLIPYRDTDYNILMTQGPNSAYTAQASNPTTSSFTYRQYQGAYNAYWRTFGYIS